MTYWWLKHIDTRTGEWNTIASHPVFEGSLDEAAVNFLDEALSDSRYQELPDEVKKSIIGVMKYHIGIERGLDRFDELTEELGRTELLSEARWAKERGITLPVVFSIDHWVVSLEWADKNPLSTSYTDPANPTVKSTIIEHSGELQCLECGRVSDDDWLGYHLEGAHDMTVEDYIDTYGLVPIAKQGWFDEHVDYVKRKTGKEPCLECLTEGENRRFKNIAAHVANGHDVEWSAYKTFYHWTGDEEDDTVSFGEYDWNRLAVAPSTLRQHEELIVETEALIEDGTMFDRLVEVFNSHGGQRVQWFNVAVGAALYVTYRERDVFVSPQEVATLVGTDRKRIWSQATRFGISPEIIGLSRRIRSKLLDIEDELAPTEREAVKSRAESYPESFTSGRKAGMIVACALYETIADMTQEEASELGDVSAVGLRNALSALEDGETPSKSKA